MSASSVATDSSQGSAVDQWRGAIFCVTVVAGAVAFSYRLTSFLLAKEAVLFAGGTLIAITIVLRGRFGLHGVRAFGPLWALLALSLLWNLVLVPCRVPADAVVELARWAALLLCIAMVQDLPADPRWRARFIDSLIVAATLIALLGTAQYAGALPGLFPEFPGYSQRAYSVFGNQDLFGGYLALAMPLALWRYREAKRTAPLFLVIVGILMTGLALSSSRSAWLAALLGSLFSLVRAPLPRKKFLIVCGVTALVSAAVLCVAPQPTLQRLYSSFGTQDHGGRLRLWFWRGTLDMIRDRPVAGVGPGNYAYWSPRYLGAVLHVSGGEGYAHNELTVDHPHSEPLGLLAEYGLVGAAFVAWQLTRMRRCAGPEWGGLIALAVFSGFNAALHSAPHALAGLMLAGALLGQTGPCGAERRRWAYAFPVFIVGMLAFFLWATFLPSLWLRAAEDQHLAGRPPFALYQRCIGHPWPAPTAHLKYGIALLEAGRLPEAETAFARAQEGLDTGEVYLALGTLALRLGDLEGARRRLEDCLFRWPSWVDAWTLLARATPEPERPPVLLKAKQWLSADALKRVETASGIRRDTRMH